MSHPSLRTARHVLLALACVGALTSCAGRLRQNDAESAPQTLLTVRNHHFLDIVVYLVRDGQQTRLGIATAASTQEFNLTKSMPAHSAEIRLIADPIGRSDRAATPTAAAAAPSTNLTSESVHVDPGQTVEWMVEANLSRSSISVH